jgi:CheY-like chemotaxis protein
VEQIRRAGDRATALVQQLLAFSRKQVVQPAVVELNEAVADLEKMLRRLIGEDIELSIASSRHPVYVEIDRTQFDQMVINLSVNARDAMPGGGPLTISTGIHKSRGAPECGGCKVHAGDFAVLTVSDRGSGMTAETRAHMFDPFFTTKEVGRGTGLGLSMVYGAVQQAGGHICVDTELGQGTTFRICLPQAANAPQFGDAREIPLGAGGRETILLVEDEELVRAMLSDALEEAGYRVLEACQGEQALEMVAQFDGAIHLLLTDVVMPRMSGQDLAERLAVLKPKTAVLYVSGYLGRDLPPGCHFLKKPFTPDELIREVRTVLDNAH